MVEGYVTAGLGAAAKAGKVSSALYGMQEVVEKIPGIRWVDEAGAPTGVARAVRGALAKLADDIAFVVNTRICFVAGTKVHTLEGLKNIEDVRPGDLVLTRAESDGITNVSPRYNPVLQTFVTHPDELYHVSLATDDGETETLSTTAGHPFYSADKAAFVEAQHLQAGDRLALPEGRTAVVTGVRIERGAPGQPFTTYNFAVADTHTYFVGRNGVWVHNIGDNPCKILAAQFRMDLDSGMSAEQALVNMGKRTDEMLVNKELVDLAARNRHLREAVEEAGLAANTTLPESVVAAGSLARGSKARELLAANLGTPNFPVPAQAHHIFGVALFDSVLGKKLQLWGIDLNGAENGVWLPKYNYPARKASLHNGAPTRAYTGEVILRLKRATSKDDALAILNRIRNDLLSGDLTINGAK